MTTDSLLQRLQRGEISAREAAVEQLAALHAVHERTHAVEWFDDERVLEAAESLDRTFAGTGPVGPLHGLPITVKDWIDVAGFPCAGGSAEQRERRPAHDATVVRRLRAAGAVVLAKTVVWAPTAGAARVAHPLDPARTAGGSSTGEAVATSTGASPLGIGSDSGGSIRLPAAWCGVHGFKPTSGLVPTTGHYPRVGPLSDGRTQIGPLSHDLDLLRLALSVMAGPDGHDAGVEPVPMTWDHVADLGPCTFAVVLREHGPEPEPAIVAAVEQVANTLAKVGLRRVEWPTAWLDDAREITERYWTRAGATGADAERLLWDWDRFRRRHLEASTAVDFIVSPVVVEPAPLDRPVIGDDFLYTLPASLTGSPAISIAVGLDTAGLPVAVQVTGRRWDDNRLLELARRTLVG